MSKYNLLLYLLMIIIVSCLGENNGKTEKNQNDRSKKINIKENILDIKTEILFGTCSLNVINDILIVNDITPSGDKCIHLFNKNTFKYITSTGIIGKGPGEVTRQGRIAVDATHRVIWVSDHGKRVMWKFYLDSILSNTMYKPSKYLPLNNELFIERFDFLNDSIALGKAVRVLSENSFDMSMASLNLNTNVTKVFGYV